MGNPIEWFEWIYGKWFVGHPWRGFFTISVVSCIVLSAIIGVIWLKALDEYTEKQFPKQRAATPTSSSAQSVAATTSASAEDHQLQTTSPAKAKHTNRAHSPAPQKMVPPTQDAAPVNSVVENAGEVDNVEIHGAKVSAPPGGRATVLRTLPGGKSTDVRIDKPTVSSNSNPETGTDGPAMGIGAGPGLHHFLIEDDEYCDSDSAAVGILPGGKLVDGLVRNNIPLNCDWVDVLSKFANDRINLKSNLAKFSEGSEKSWDKLPDEVRSKNRTELSQISDQLLNAPEGQLGVVINKLTTAPPHFDVRFGRLSMLKP
jgi:hypothetical protein